MFSTLNWSTYIDGHILYICNRNHKHAFPQLTVVQFSSNLFYFGGCNDIVEEVKE